MGTRASDRTQLRHAARGIALLVAIAAAVGLVALAIAAVLRLVVG